MNRLPGKTALKICLIGAVFAAASLAGNIDGASASTATISNIASQTVKGWGAFPSYFRSDWATMPNQYQMFTRPAIQDADFTLGLTHFRVDVEPRLYVSGNTVSDIVLSSSALSDLITQINIGRSHGVSKYIMSCWSPPAVWKLPQQNINGQVTIKGQVTPEYLDPTKDSNYAAYYTKVLQTLAAQGVGLPVAISIQNEPDVYPTYDGCFYDWQNTDPTISNHWKNLEKTMRATFDANGLGSVMIHGPECATSDQDANFLGGDGCPALGTDSALNTAMANFASHTYGENWWTGLQNGEAQHPRDAWITEWSIFDSRFGTGETNFMLASLRHFASNFVDLPNNYWFWWMEWAYGTAAPGGGSLLSGDQTPILSKRYYIFQKLWTTIKPGWVVHKMTCDDSNFTTSNTLNVQGQDTLVDLVCFWDPTGTQSVTLLVNHTTSAVNMTVNGLTGSTQTTYLSDATHDMANVGSGAVTGGSAVIALPASSVTAVVTPSPSTTAPSAPTGLTATAGNGQVSLAWTAVAGASSYNVKRATTSGGPYTQLMSMNANSAINMSLANGTTYYYVVTAVSAVGESANSAQVSATPQPQVPAAPSGLTAAPGVDQISLSWSVSSGATSYNVKRSLSNGGPYTTVGTATSASYTDTGLTTSTTYYYVISAVNATGESPNSSQVSAAPSAPTTAPAAPSSLTGVANSGVQVTLSWVDNANNEAGFYLERESYSNGFVQVATLGANATSYVDTGVTYGVPYSYRIRAYNSIGTSAYSNTATVSTPHH